MTNCKTINFIETYDLFRITIQFMCYHPLQILQKSPSKEGLKCLLIFLYAHAGKGYRTVFFLKMPIYFPFKASASKLCSERIYK